MFSHPDAPDVTPLAGVWIEISLFGCADCFLSSLPSRECGLKLPAYSLHFCPGAVTPLAGVWIEIALYHRSGHYQCVTPLAGVWIEISDSLQKPASKVSLPSRECGLKSVVLLAKCRDGESLPSRECGLKLYQHNIPVGYGTVTPLAGVWIEIGKSQKSGMHDWSLPSRECGLKSLCRILPARHRCHSPRGSVD